MNRYPYHRYLRYLVLGGDDAEEIRRHVADLGFIPPKFEDCQFLIKTLYEGKMITDEWRKRNDVDIFEEESVDMDGMNWLVENAPARVAVERSLFDGLSARHCATIVTLKFGFTLSERSASLFRRCFWDTEELTKIDFANYFAMAHQRKPDPPPASVPLKMRAAFSAWESGVIPDEEELSTEDIIRTLQVDAFMEYAKARATSSPMMQDQARKWATIATRISQIRKPAKAVAEKGSDLPGLRPLVYHPDQSTPTLADLENPDDDPI